MGLPVSDGYDIISWMMNIGYDEAKKVDELPDIQTKNILSLLHDGIPTAYITKRREFYGREFYIDENVLIPRVETEILVEEALKTIANIRNAKVLDLCTGSGCILLSILAESPDTFGCGIDISSAAIKVAVRNRELLGINDRAVFKEADVTSFAFDVDDYDIIVCNPPYLTEDEYVASDIRLKYEPKLALTATDEGLFFYKNILRNISLLGKKDCTVIFEIGYTQSTELMNIASEMGFESYFIRDLAGIDRVMKCLLKRN